MTALKCKFKISNIKLGFTSTLFTLLLVSGFVYLGFWQLGRAELKKNWANTLENSHSTLTWEKMLKNADDKGQLSAKASAALRFHPLKITGSFLKDAHILLDNQIMKGRGGYQVFTAFQPKNSQTLILINRGWVPAEANRDTLPKILSNEGEITVEGRINQPQKGLILKHETIHNPQWPLRVQSIDYDELSHVFQKDLLPITLDLTPNSPESFVVLPINFNFQVSRHLGYAVQWFTIAVVTLIYYVIIYIRQSKLCNKKLLKHLA